MKTNTVIIITALIIGLSLIGSGMIISRAVVAAEAADNTAASGKSLLMNEESAANYLGIKLETLRNILKSDSKEKQNMNAYPTYKYIPYMNIEGNKYFNTEELQKWVEYNMHNF